MKRFTILSREVLSRGKGGYYNKTEEKIFLADMTDKKITEKLEELNKNKRTNFFEISKDFNLKTKQGSKEFVNYYLENSKECSIKKFKNEVIDIINNWQ